MTPERPNLAPAVLLVVDDDPHSRELEQVILEPAGYQVFRVSSGPAAIALLERGRPLDLLIADLSMPEMDGPEMVRRIRTTRPDLKVLYVTGHIDMLMDVRPLGKNEAFLEKPFTYLGLREAVSMLLYGTVTKPPATA
jgi:two-component system cell cycle sensor histidine kinase/response regulator CckA